MAANPREWRFPAYLGFFVYTFGSKELRHKWAGYWYAKAAAIPGRPAYIPQLAAKLLSKSGERDQAIAMWASVYAESDKYAREKAMKALDRLLPADAQQRAKELSSLRTMMPPQTFLQLLHDLGVGPS
jgi:hypothetical protein